MTQAKEIINETVTNTVRSTNLERLKYTIFAISFYIFFSGALYFYGLMDELGFKGASLDSIFSPLVYAQYYIIDIFSKAFLVQGIDLLIFPLKNSAFVTSIILGFALIVKFKVGERLLKKYKPKFTPQNSLIKSKPVIASLLTFPMIYLGHLAIFAVFITVLLFTTIPLMMPYSLGTVAAQKMVEQNNGRVCENLDWASEKYESRSIILSCERIRVGQNGKVVVGSIVHSDQKFSYVITNYLLLRVKDDKVISCRTKQHKNSNDVKADKGYVETLTTCDALYELPVVELR